MIPIFRLFTSGLIFAALATGVSAADRVAFVGVALDQETRDADRLLQDYLQRSSEIRFAPEELEYSQVIERLSNWTPDQGLFVARTTPYVQVVAEMLGADMEVLSTYISEATGSTTYHSYFVVRKDRLPPNPTPADVVAFIAGQPERARFIYHSLFSTSSFFVPSLHFRANGVFHMAESTESLVAIDADLIDENSSSALVRAVARGEADVAAVWDGTRARFVEGGSNPADIALGRGLAMVRLPSTIPNDLLVCPSWAPQEFKDGIRSAIRNMPSGEIAVGDFATWIDITDASQARAALAQLRWLAREQTAPVTVDVRAAGTNPGTSAMVEAAKHAVRLSGTEFVLFDEDFHEHIDFVWTLDEIHDGAAQLRSSIPGTGIDDQVFPISFHDPEDLTRRIVGLMRERLHRIRYVWPYSGSQPIVIRDTTLALPTERKVPVQRITWLDQERNSFRAGPIFEVGAEASTPFTHELVADDFRRSGNLVAELDPLSNVSYRVYQLRVIPSNRIFRFATGAMVALLVFAAAAAILALRRKALPELLEEETLRT